MKKNMTRIIALLLALMLLAGLCGCGGNGSGSGDAGNGGGSGSAAPTDSGGSGAKGLKKVRLEHVYTTKYLPSGIMEGIDYIQQVNCAGGSVYMTASYDHSYEGKDGEYVSDYGVKLYRLSQAGDKLEEVATFTNNYVYDEETSTALSTNVNSVVPCQDGSFWYYKQEYFEDWSDPENQTWENKGGLVHQAADGTEIDYIPSTELTEEDYFYVQRMMAMPDGSLFLQTGEGVMGLDSAGKLLYKKKMNDDTWINSVARTGNGDIVVLVNTYDRATYRSQGKLQRLDPVTGEMTELGDMPAANLWQIMDGAGDCVLMQGASALFSYDIKTLEYKEMLNWINSDVNANRIGNIASLPDGRLLIMEYDREYSNNRLAFMERQDEVIEKYVLNFASVWLDDNLRDAIINFNKQNADYRIQYIDYSVYNTEEDYTGGYTKLNQDIISGQIPDILSMEGLNYDVYASKGLLDDLSKRIESDPELDRSEYLESVFNATEVGGKVYSLIPAFNLVTVAGRSDNVGDKPGWTMADLQALRQRYPDAQVFENMERNQVLSYITGMTLDSFIDADTGKCSFNSPDFIALLEFVKSFPETIDWEKLYSEAGEEYWKMQENQFKENRTLLQQQYIYGYDSMKRLDYSFGGPVTLVGFPVPEGVGSAINPQVEIAISSRSKLSDVCWDFVKYMLSEEYQSSLSWSFPICKDCLQRMQDEAMKPRDEQYAKYGVSSPANITVAAAAGEQPVEEEAPVDEALPEDEGGLTDEEQKDPEDSAASAGAASISTPGYGYGNDYWSAPLTQDQADRLNAALNSVDSVFREHKDVNAIIQEEAGAFFSGQKTAEAVVEIIQSRVSIFEAESR